MLLLVRKDWYPIEVEVLDCSMKSKENIKNQGGFKTTETVAKIGDNIIECCRWNKT